MSDASVMLLASGDIGPNYEPVDRFAELVLPVLSKADLRFAQCERTYSERGTGRLGNGRLLPNMASIWQTTGIDIISMAGNHGMDNGADAMLDTIKIFQDMGKCVVGAGRNKEEAHKPRIVECKGVKIAFLAYCSVITEGHEAQSDSPGIAPMRAYTYYRRGKDQTEEFHPGTPAEALTVPDEDDLDRMRYDIGQAKQRADVVIISLHWGIHMIPKTLADYQPLVAHAAIDAGADLILGHHPHCLKAVETYKGKVCFYSMGNFMKPSRPNIKPRSNLWKLYWLRIEPEYAAADSLYRYPLHCCYSMLVKATLSRQGIDKISFLPVFINPQGQPAAVGAQDPRFDEIMDHVKWVSDQYPTKFLIDNDEVIVVAK